VDYPDDLRPSIDAAPKWTAPYPKLQSNEKYDADYVKDENADGGHWKAQMDYDTIKMRYAKQQQVVKDAAAKAGLEGKEADDAAKVRDSDLAKASLADGDAKKAGDDAATADADLDAATKEELAAEAAAAKRAGKSQELYSAEQKVEKAELHLKDCEKAVDDAKAELAKVKAAEANKSAADKSGKDSAITNAKGKQAEKSGVSKSKHATLSEKEAAAAAARKQAELDSASASKEGNEGLTAKQILEKEQQKLHELAAAMSEAEARLRRFRGEPASPAQFNADSKSGAKQVSVWLLVMALVGFAHSA